MTSKPEYFNPRTGKPLYRAPIGATIPAKMDYWITTDDKTSVLKLRAFTELKVQNIPEVFTEEPIAEPAPELPTKPGYYMDDDEALWQLAGEYWEMVAPVSCLSTEEAKAYAPFTPMHLVPDRFYQHLLQTREEHQVSPSMKATGEPCDEYCTDCGGKRWIK